MSLTCYCDSDDDNAEWFYFPPEDFTTLDTKRSRRCCSCKQKIKVGETVAKFSRFRSSVRDVEVRIYGDEVPLSPFYMCETCGGLYYAVQDLGMCCDIQSDVKEQIAEYRECNEVTK